MDIEKFADEVMKKAKKPVDRGELLKRLGTAAAKRDQKVAQLAKERERRKALREALRAPLEREVKEGLAYLEGKKERFTMLACMVAGYQIGIGVFDDRGDGQRYFGGACFCAPSDKWSGRVAAGLIAKRILYKPIFDFDYKKKVSPDVPLHAAMMQVIKVALTSGKDIPDRVRKECLKPGGFALFGK